MEKSRQAKTVSNLERLPSLPHDNLRSIVGKKILFDRHFQGQGWWRGTVIPLIVTGSLVGAASHPNKETVEPTKNKMRNNDLDTIINQSYVPDIREVLAFG